LLDDSLDESTSADVCSDELSAEDEACSADDISLETALDDVLFQCFLWCHFLWNFGPRGLPPIMKISIIPFLTSTGYFSKH